MLERRANNWENTFYPANNLLTPRNEDGTFVPGITKTTTDHYVEGDAYEYLWNVPNNYEALFNLLGGKAKADAMLKKFLSQPNGFGEYAQLTNEFGFGEQYALDYAGDPAATQRLVNLIRYSMYRPGPSLENNDDLGANSSTYIWEMLGMYPENSGSDDLVFNSPGFPHAQITLPSGKKIRINAPGADSEDVLRAEPEAQRQGVQQAVRPVLDARAGLDPRTGRSGRRRATGAPARTRRRRRTAVGTEAAVGYVSDTQVAVAPGGSNAVTLGAQNATDTAQTVTAKVTAPAGLTVTPRARRSRSAPRDRGTVQLHVAADASTKQTFYTVKIALTTGFGQQLSPITVTVLVAPPGSLLRAFTNKGVSDDSDVNAANFDGGGWSYSAEALAAQGVTPDSTVTAGRHHLHLAVLAAG